MPTTETNMSLETRLLNVKHKLGQYLTKSYLNRLLDSINDSDHTRVVLQAVIMILGHNYMSDRTLHIVLNKKSAITRIKTWNRCKLHRHKVLRIKNWMEYRPGTFGETTGYKGDNLLHALRDWCIIMVSNRKPIKKQIATSEHQTQSSLSPKIKNVESSSDETVCVPKKSLIGKSDDTKSAEEIVPNASKAPTMKSKGTKSKKSNTMKQSVSISSTAAKPEVIKPKEIKSPKLNTMKQSVDITAMKSKSVKSVKFDTMKRTVSKQSEPATMNTVSVASTMKISKEVQVHPIYEENGTNTALAMSDKSVETAFDIRHQPGKQMEFKSLPMVNRTNALRTNNMSRLESLKNKLQGMNAQIDDHLSVLLDAKKQLNEAKKDINDLKCNNKVERHNDEDEWKKQREFILKKIANDQIRLQKRLKRNQPTFSQ